MSELPPAFRPIKKDPRLKPPPITRSAPSPPQSSVSEYATLSPLGTIFTTKAPPGVLAPKANAAPAGLASHSESLIEIESKRFDSPERRPFEPLPVNGSLNITSAMLPSSSSSPERVFDPLFGDSPPKSKNTILLSPTRRRGPGRGLLPSAHAAAASVLASMPAVADVENDTGGSPMSSAGSSPENSSAAFNVSYSPRKRSGKEEICSLSAHEVVAVVRQDPLAPLGESGNASSYDGRDNRRTASEPRAFPSPKKPSIASAAAKVLAASRGVGAFRGKADIIAAQTSLAEEVFSLHLMYCFVPHFHVHIPSLTQVADLKEYYKLRREAEALAKAASIDPKDLIAEADALSQLFPDDVADHQGMHDITLACLPFLHLLKPNTGNRGARGDRAGA